jgi:hypothetical protein
VKRSAALISTLVAAVAAAAALAAGSPVPSATTNSLFSPDGSMYTTKVAGHRTTVTLWRNVRKLGRTSVDGAYGLPLIANDGTTEGVSHDGGTLVLGSTRATKGRFAVLDAHTLRVRRMVDLRGQFTFDALDPRGRTLYLIQHVSSQAGDRYSVRAYDLSRGRLVKQVVFDKREESSLMSGSPVTRATGPSGRWVYTLYAHPNGSLFVHALDSVDRHAFCIDLPRRGSPSTMWSMRLKLRPGTLSVLKGTTRFAAIDTKSLRVRA